MFRAKCASCQDITHSHNISYLNKVRSKQRSQINLFVLPALKIASNILPTLFSAHISGESNSTMDITGMRVSLSSSAHTQKQKRVLVCEGEIYCTHFLQ